MLTEQTGNKRLKIKMTEGTKMTINKERTELRLILTNRR